MVMANGRMRTRTRTRIKAATIVMMKMRRNGALVLNLTRVVVLPDTNGRPLAVIRRHWDISGERKSRYR